MSTESVVFFSRCRPQDSDPIDIVKRERRVFIGYPAFRKGVVPRRGHLREAVVDFDCSDDEWKTYAATIRDKEPLRQYEMNRRFVLKIKPGAIALVPRPSQGVVFAGRVVKPFELLDDPPWSDDYLCLRRRQHLDVEDECGHLADVAQCCTVDHFRKI